jgi:hypothetical protein
VLALPILLLLGPTAGAEGLLKQEPRILAPGETVYVDNGRCSRGKILKVTAAFKGTARRKTCISLPTPGTILN